MVNKTLTQAVEQQTQNKLSLFNMLMAVHFNTVRD